MHNVALILLLTSEGIVGRGCACAPDDARERRSHF